MCIVTIWTILHLLLSFYRNILKSEDNKNGKCNGLGDASQKMSRYLLLNSKKNGRIFHYHIILKNLTFSVTVLGNSVKKWPNNATGNSMIGFSKNAVLKIHYSAVQFVTVRFRSLEILFFQNLEMWKYSREILGVYLEIFKISRS